MKDSACTISGETITRLMRTHKTTIKETAARMRVSPARVRIARENGVAGYLTSCDWIEGITGRDVFSRAKWQRIIADTRRRQNSSKGSNR